MKLKCSQRSFDRSRLTPLDSFPSFNKTVDRPLSELNAPKGLNEAIKAENLIFSSTIEQEFVFHSGRNFDRKNYR